MAVDQAVDFETIFQWERMAERTRQTEVTNLSFWNPSAAYQQAMRFHLFVEPSDDYFNYLYSQDLDISLREGILSKMTAGQSRPDEALALLTSSSTCSITNVINFLKQSGRKKLAILTPAYFTPEENCRLFGLSFEKIPLCYQNGRYRIPAKAIRSGGFDAVWVTSPVYSTGVGYEAAQVKEIADFIEEGILVVADETLALPGQMLSEEISIGENFLAICSPHKPLFINGVKFSAILHPKETDAFFEKWIDVLGGALTQSNVRAARHYLSDNFDYIVQQSRAWFADSLAAASEAADAFEAADCGQAEVSPYVTVTMQRAAADVNDLSVVRDLIENEGVSYIPGIYNDFPQAFRVNLSYTPELIYDKLPRVLLRLGCS